MNAPGNKVLRLLAAVLVLGCAASSVAAADLDSTPKLILTPKLLKRLRRDRDRQTARWVDLQNRVQGVADSPERGFELALYYQVSQEAASCHAAGKWAVKHPREIRQNSFIEDWCSSVLTQDELKAIAPAPLALQITQPSFAALDTLLLEGVAFGSEPKVDNTAWQTMLHQLQERGPSRLSDSELYSLAEFLVAVRTSTHEDLRRAAAGFFAELPAELLLSLKPDRIASPGWQLHAAALAMVTMDPNLDGAGFLQGWGIEDSQTVHEGPGVAYEFLWADPYLPGVSYQNLEPWAYDAAGRLFARSSWSPDACWLALSSRAPEQINCPAGWDSQTIHFGHMTLIPATARCIDVPRHPPNETVILWRLAPGETLVRQQPKDKNLSRADSAGLLRLSEEITGRVCAEGR